MAYVSTMQDSVNKTNAADTVNRVALGSIKRADYLTLGQASRMLPGTPTAGTLARWVREGIRIGDQVIRLRAVAMGKRLFTQVIWLEEFSDATQAARISATQPKPATSVPELTETNAAMTLREHGV